MEGMVSRDTGGSDGVVLAWQVLKSTVVHSTREFTVCNDSVIRPDGRVAEYSHIVAPCSVTVLAVDQDDFVLLTRQWVYTRNGSEWRLPGGSVAAEEPDLLGAASRELAKNTGFRADSWTKLGVIHGADSVSNHADHQFLATGLTAGPVQAGPGAARQVRRVAFADVVGLVCSGMILHAGSACAVLRTALDRAAGR